jgi:hypothetical protein
MASFVRNDSKIAFNRIKIVFFLSKDLPKFACRKISATISILLYQGMVYVFEMCDIVFTKTETPESRQIETQDCFKFANFIMCHVDFKVFLGKIRKIWDLDDFLHS